MSGKLRNRVEKTKSVLCVGLDSALEKLPERFQTLEHPQFEFNKWIIEQTHQYTAAYKPNTAFYEARGSAGWRELEMTMEYLRASHPDIFTICDAKRADIGSTNHGYVTAIFDHMGFDAITLHPYLGAEALQPFLDRSDKTSIILCHTSNPGAGELQELELAATDSDGTQSPQKLWQQVAHTVARDWNTHNNCMLVMGATYPQELQQVRQIVGDMPLLVPGVGAQGGDLQQVLENGHGTSWPALLINSSRGVIFAADPAAEAEKLATAMI